jgi:hypothetical protein
VLVIVICFMAVTSSGASEMVAVSSLFTFDVYRRYINPTASGSRLVMVSRVLVCVWAIIMGAIMCIAQATNINVNWLITIIGALVAGGWWVSTLLEQGWLTPSPPCRRVLRLGGPTALVGDYLGALYRQGGRDLRGAGPGLRHRQLAGRCADPERRHQHCDHGP